MNVSTEVLVSVIALFYINMVFSNYTGPKSEKIVGGIPVDIEVYPHLAALFNDGGLCASSILNSWSALTAAHCFNYNKDVSAMIIQTGSRYLYEDDGTQYKIAAIRIHPHYNKTTIFACDVAVVFVQGPIKFSNAAKKAILVNTNTWKNEKDKNFEVSGWGYTEYEGDISDLGLLTARLGIVRSRACEKMHNRKLAKGMFCLYGGAKRDACRGDSGGGVIWKGMVVGIVSHGYKCAQKNRPSVYADVYYFRRWIRNTVISYLKRHCKIL